MFERPECCPAAQPHPLPGDLLVAAAGSSGGGCFDASVVLLIDADDYGAFGVIINRPLPTEAVALNDVLPGWGDVASAPAVLYQGGPVQTDGAVCLAVARENDTPPGWRPVRGRLGLLNLDTPLPAVEHRYVGMRIFAGYAGWEAGQLEDELADGLWYLLPGSPQDVLAPNPGALWRAVLRRVRGDVALFSTWTPTPELN